MYIQNSHQSLQPATSGQVDRCLSVCTPTHPECQLYLGALDLIWLLHRYQLVVMTGDYQLQYVIQPCIPDPRGRRQSQDFVASAVDGVPAIPGRAGPAAGAAAFPG